MSDKIETSVSQIRDQIQRNPNFAGFEIKDIRSRAGSNSVFLLEITRPQIIDRHTIEIPLVDQGDGFEYVSRIDLLQKD